MKHYHDNPMGGHLSKDKLLPTLKKRFYWNNMDRYVQEYTRRCNLCALIKSNANINHGLLRPITVTRPFQLVGVDIAIMRTSGTGYKYILVTIDYFTNWVEAIPMKNQTADECIKAFFKSVISRHGCPEEIMSDSGTQFLSGDFKVFCDNYNIKQRQSSPNSHQANGKIEKFVRFLKQALALITPQDVNMSVQRDNLRPKHNTNNVSYQKQLTLRLQEAYETLIKHKEKEQKKYKRYYDKSHKDVQYNIGEQVLILYDSPAKGPLMPRWEGPFTIIQKVNSVIYRLENEDKITTAHVQRMVRVR